MTGRAVRRVDFGSVVGIAWSRRSVGRENFAAQDVGLRPGADSTDNGIDLFVGEHAARALREGRHRGAGYAICGGAANRGIVGDREENGIAQRDRRSALAAGAVASRAVLRVENVEVHNLVGRDHLRVRDGPAWRMAAGGAEHARRRPRKQERWTGGSLAQVLSVPLVHGARRFNAGANGEGKVLPGAYALLPGDDDSRDNAEPHLGDDKPEPVNPIAEHGIQELHKAMDQTDHKMGAITPPNRIGRRGNIGSMAP